MPPEPRPTPTILAASVPPVLLSLGPVDLHNHRRTRYMGDDLHVALSALTQADGETLRTAYRVLNGLLNGFADPGWTDRERWDHVERWCDDPEHGLKTILQIVQRLGHDTLERNGHVETFAKVLHDLRGGALTALLGYLHLLERLPRTETTLKMIFVLTRDHLKIMRNSLVGLDDVRRQADRTPRSHNVRLILEKWHESVVAPRPPNGGAPVAMFVDNHYEGALTECCLESAAIDRIFYNLAANACRHCAPGGRLDMSIYPLPPGGRDLRFVLSNPVGSEDVATLHALGYPARDDGPAENTTYLDALFRPQVSSTGSGYGLAVVADFVAGAYGLEDAAEAVAGRYVGARLDGDVFRVFFHWPAARNDFPQKLDDPHRPGESLSGG